MKVMMSYIKDKWMQADGNSRAKSIGCDSNYLMDLAGYNRLENDFKFLKAQKQCKKSPKVMGVECTSVAYQFRKHVHLGPNLR